MRRAATTGKNKPSASSSSKRTDPASRSTSAPHPQAPSKKPSGRISSRPSNSDTDTSTDSLCKYSALAMEQNLKQVRRSGQANRGNGKAKASKPVRRRVDRDDKEDEPAPRSVPTPHPQAPSNEPSGRIPSRPSNSDTDTGTDSLYEYSALAMEKNLKQQRRSGQANRGKGKAKASKPVRRRVDSDDKEDEPAPRSVSTPHPQAPSNEPPGRILSRPPNSDTDTSTDSLCRFAAGLDMVKDIEHERRFREANRGKARPKAFKPLRRHVDNDDEDELSPDTLKALKWRPIKGRAPEHMSRAVAAQQRKVNPLIKALGIKIKIVRSDEGLDTGPEDDDESSPSPLPPRSAPSTSKTPVPPPKRSSTSDAKITSRQVPEDQTGLSGQRTAEVLPSTTNEPAKSNQPDKNKSTAVDNYEQGIISELSTTEDGSGLGTRPAAPSDVSPIPPRPAEQLLEDIIVTETLSTTEDESDHRARPAAPSRVSPPPPLTDEQLLEDIIVNETLSTTEDESDHGARAPGRHLSPFNSHPAEKSKEANISVVSELSTTASEGYSKAQKAAYDSVEMVDEDLSSTDYGSEREPAGKKDAVSSRVVDPTGSRSVKRKLSDHSITKSPAKKARADVTSVPKTYPRVQTEARPNFEIMDADQDDIAPLVLDNSCQLSANINRFLKPYQRDGVKFFFEHFRAKNGVILGDDMGLGKTIQVIAFLTAVIGLKGTPDEEHRRQYAIYRSRSNRLSKPTKLGPTCLVICPNSIIDNWAREIKTWGYMEFATLDTTRNPRDTIKRFNSGALDILICGFTYARDHIDELYDLDFTVVVVDEVHKLKNPKSNTTLAFHRFKTKIRIGLTGTALQNNLFELHSLFDWARPGCLGTLAMWQAFVSDPILQSRKMNASSYEKQLGEARAKALVHNYWPDLQLRRTKIEILHELPARTDKIAFCPMTATQQRAYKNLSSDPDVANMRKHAEPCPCKKKNKKGQRFPLGLCCGQGWVKRIFPYMTAFKKIANHLALAYPNKQDKREKYAQDKDFIRKMFPEDYKKREHYPLCDYETELCGKWLVLKPLLYKWREEGSKVLIFSQWTKMMDILSFWFELETLSYVRLDGKVPLNERLARVDKFQNDEDNFIFLASTSAAGVGLNLTAANKVVIFDPSWNPSNDAQAMDRVVRIGQKREVECIRLISRGTAEELIYHRQVYKQHLSEVANTGNAPSRHFKGVQGDKKNQGEIFGVKNIFKSLGARAGSHPEDRRDELAYALGQLMEHAGSGRDAREETEGFTLEDMRLRPEESQPNPNSTEALLRACGVDSIVTHGDIVKEPSGSGKAREPNLTPKGISNREKKTHGPRLVTEIPLRGALKAKPQQVTKKGKEPELRESSLDTSKEDVQTLQKICDLECGRAVNLDEVLKKSKSKTQAELAKAYQSWKLAKQQIFLQQVKKFF